MIEYLHHIKQTHIGLALCSGLLFALRGLLVLLGRSRWGNAAWVRYLSYSLDTALLTAALMLLTILHRIPGYAWGWLWMKLALLVAYVVLGILALRMARTRLAQWLCYLGALLLFVQVYFIARTHHPLGLLALI